jgi:hypothetical protein
MIIRHFASALLIATIAGGCCGVGAGPGKEQVQRSLADITAGTPADEAMRRLQRQGFDPFYTDSGDLWAKKLTNTCFVEDGIGITVHLDSDKKVTSLDVWEYRIPL